MSRQLKIALGLWPFIFAGLLLTGAMNAERWFFPVVDTFSVTGVIREPEAITISGHLNKLRPCTFVGVSAAGNDNGITHVDLPLVFLDDTKPDTHTRPTGSQKWGPWKIYIPLAPNVESVTLIAAHECHPLWLTQSNLITVSTR